MKLQKMYCHVWMSWYISKTAFQAQLGTFDRIILLINTGTSKPNDFIEQHFTRLWDDSRMIGQEVMCCTLTVAMVMFICWGSFFPILNGKKLSRMWSWTSCLGNLVNYGCCVTQRAETAVIYKSGYRRKTFYIQSGAQFHNKYMRCIQV